MRYYLHITLLEGQIDDTEGSLFDGLDQAKEEARLALTELAAEAIFCRGLCAVGIKISSEDEELAIISVDPAVEMAIRATWAGKSG